MSRRRLTAVLALTVSTALIWPAPSPANHTRTIATVSAKVKSQRATDLWTVELRWTATCLNVAEGKEAVFNGQLYLVDADSGERTSVGGVVSRPDPSTSGSRETYVAAIARPQRLVPQLVISCYETFPQDGGPATTATGDAVIIPARFGGGGSGGGRMVPAEEAAVVQASRLAVGVAVLPCSGPTGPTSSQAATGARSSSASAPGTGSSDAAVTTA